MHPLALKAIVRSVQKRVAQGDCPTEPPHSREVLENAIVGLLHMLPKIETNKLPTEAMTDKTTDLVGRLRKPLSHNACDDRWYSCPKAAGGCADESQGNECNCGADRINAERAEAADRIERLEAKLREDRPWTMDPDGTWRQT